MWTFRWYFATLSDVDWSFYLGENSETPFAGASALSVAELNQISYNLSKWSHRLTVRTPGSHPGNPGSIPGEITKVNTPLLWRGIYFGKLSSRARSRRVREAKCSKMSLLILQASGNRELNDRLPGGATRRLLALATQQSHSVLCLKHYQQSEVKFGIMRNNEHTLYMPWQRASQPYRRIILEIT